MRKRNFVLPTLAMMALIGCSDSSELDRNHRIRNTYNTREECMRDWNNTPQDCQYDARYHGFMSPWYPYYMYLNGYNSGRYHSTLGFVPEGSAVVVSRSSLASSGGKISISRGGFGSTAHGFSAGE